MDFKQIQELIKMVNKSNIGELTIEQKDFRVTIKQKEEHVTQVYQLRLYMQLLPMQLRSQHASMLRPATSAAPSAEKPKAAEAACSQSRLPLKAP